MHDASKVLLETTGSSFKQVSNFDADPDDFPAGVAVRRAAGGGLQLEDDSTAALVGVSLGRSLSNADRVSVVRKGDGVPLRLKSYNAAGTVTVSSYANLLTTTPDTVEVAGTVFTAQAGAATLGDATFRAATSNNATAASLAAQINAHEDTKDLVTAVAVNAVNAVVTVTAKAFGAGANALTLAYADNGSATVGASVSGATLTGGIDVAVVGQKVYVNDDGLACDDGDGDAAATGAVYESGPLTGVDKVADAEVPVALIDMTGGL